MLNPWGDIPRNPPFILDDDLEPVDRFNQSAPGATRIELALLPEPYVGRVDAPVLLLTLNPGVSADDFALHEDAAFRAKIRQCHRQEPMEYPNYYLDPEVSGPGARWLHRITRPLVTEFGARVVSRQVTLIEFFPYHSIRFAHSGVRVPSQQYSLRLVNEAIARDAVIFITRGRKIWQSAIPQLKTYHRVYATRSAQNIVISPKNCPDGYPVVAAALRAASD